MIKKLFKKLMADETSDAAAFLGFGIFVLILCIILSFHLEFLLIQRNQRILKK